MTKDRLAELKAAQGDEDDVAVVVEDKEEYMQDFFQEVQQIGESLHNMEVNVEEVNKIHSSILSAPQTDDSMFTSLCSPSFDCNPLLFDTNRSQGTVGRING